MIHKAATTNFDAFILITVLMITSNTSALAQTAGGRGEPQTREAASQAEALFKNALLLTDTEDSKSARLQLQEAMRLWIQIREPRMAAVAALQMGDRYKKARKYRDALDYYRRALETKSIPGVVRANALNAIAQIYAGLYLPDLAVRYFNQALDHARAIGDPPARILALTGLADLYHRQAKPEKALSCLTPALRLSRKDHADSDPALLYLLGQVSQERGLVENARSAFEEALAIYQKTGDVEGQVKVLCAASALYLVVSRRQEALEQAEQAVDLAEKLAKRVVSDADEINARESRWRAWLALARAERSLGRGDAALASYAQSIAHFRAIWWEFYIATEASAIAFREEGQGAYREYADLLVERGELRKAYEVADEAKARTLQNFLSARRGRPPSGDSKQAAVLRDLGRSVALANLQLLSPGLSREQQTKLQKEIEDIELKIDETRLQAEMGHASERLVWSQPATVDQLQRQLAQGQMTLAEFSLGEKRSFLWVFSRGEVFFEIRPGRKEIEKAVRPFLASLAAAPHPLYLGTDLAKLKEQSEALFATLFGRLSREIEQGQRLIVVPDGLLHYLPFEALIQNGRYLVEGHEISYLPSASMLTAQQDSRTEGETADRMDLLAFGDPSFSPTNKAPPPKSRGSNPDIALRSARASRGFQLPVLPRTRDEVQNIAGLFPADRTRIYLGNDSTEDAVKRETLRRYRRLHFATHSFIDEDFPSRSAVVLTLDTDPDEDGFLEAAEISGLDLDCDLVVLSACQTGRGRLSSGEGIVGLSRAFLYAGARAVVVSHWNVSDISTSRLMESFYRHLTAGGGNAAALRETKLEMLNSDNETRHPYYWASFVIVGRP